MEALEVARAPENELRSGNSHASMNASDHGGTTSAAIASRSHNPRDSSTTKSDGNRSADTSHGNKTNSNKFRCRVAMACVHCRHRKIRCDGAQPSCYTCTRLQRKCEYERVSEQDNLLSRERKRLSRERKAARLAASASQAAAASQPTHGQAQGQPQVQVPTQQLHSARSQQTKHQTIPASSLPTSSDEKNIVSMPQIQPPTSKSTTSPFSLSIPSLGVTHTPTEVAPALIQPPNDPAMASAWSSGANTLVPSKDLMPWAIPPSLTTTDAATLTATNSISPSLSTISGTLPNDALPSLRSTADPSLLEMSAPPSALSDASPSSPTGGLADATSLSPTEPPFGSDTGTTLSSMSAGSLSSEATLVDPLELKTSLDTPLKLFSDQHLPSSMAAATPSSVDSLAFSDSTTSHAFGNKASMATSPLSPQLAPPSFDTIDTGFDHCSLGSFDPDSEEHEAGLGLYSSSLPTLGHTGLGMDLEPSSLPILSSWAHPSSMV